MVETKALCAIFNKESEREKKMFLHTTIFYSLIIFTIIVETYFIIRDKKIKFKKEKNDRGSRLFASIGTLFSIIITVILRFLKIGSYNSEIVFWSGLVIAVAGIIFRLISINYLGLSFSSTVSTYENQKIITTGPYKYIRHPCYTGIIIMSIGFVLTAENWPSIIILLVIMISTLLYRVKIEEQYMIIKFGKEYEDYMKKTKKMIPFLF